MTDLLIRDVPDGVLGAIDQRAKPLGLSRTEYLRRALEREAAVLDAAVPAEDLRRIADRIADLVDDEVMRQAWE